MKSPTIVLLALATIAPLDRAAAQGQDQFALGLAAGITVASGALKDNHTNGPAAIVSFGIGSVDSPVGIRFDGMYSPLGDRKDGTAPTDQGKARLFSLTGNFVFNLYGEDIRLYGVGGLGGYWYNPDGDSTEARNEFGYNGGLGFWLPVVNGFVEARFHNMYRALPDPLTLVPGKKSARFYQIVFGVIR